MSKHVKALRGEIIDELSSGMDWSYEIEQGCETPMDVVRAAADHMEKLERQLRIARMALQYIKEQSARPGCQTGANPWDAAEQALAAMRQAGRKK